MRFLDALLRRKSAEKATMDWTKKQPVPELQRIIEAKRYSTLDSKCIAQGPVSSLFIPSYVWLFQTNNHNFFYVARSAFAGTTIASLTQDEAVKLYEQSHWQEVEYKQAFPNIEVTDA